MPDLIAATAQKADWGTRLSVFANPNLAPAQRGFGQLRMLCDDVFEQANQWHADHPPHNMHVLDVVIAGSLSYRSADHKPIHASTGQAMLCRSGASMTLHAQALTEHTRRIRLGWQSHTVNATPSQPTVLPLPIGTVALTDQAIINEPLGLYLLHGTATTDCGQTINAHDWLTLNHTEQAPPTASNSQWLVVPNEWPSYRQK